MPLHVVLELLERLAAASAGVLKIPADEASFWPADLPATLQRSGLLELTSPLETVTCPGCDEACLMPVEIRVHGNSRPGSAFVVCDRRDDIGLVPLRPDQIRCWQLSGAVAARVLATTLQLMEPRQPAPPLPCWTLGVLELPTGVITVHFSLVPLDRESALRLHGVGDEGRSHLLLLPPGVSCASLPVNVRAVDLGEVLEWNGQGISLSPAVLLRRLGAAAPIARPPFLFKQDSAGIWTIRFENRDCPPIRGLVGMRHLRHLLQNPNHPISARELLALGRGTAELITVESDSQVGALAQQGFDVRSRDFSESPLDARALRDFRTRIEDINTILEEEPIDTKRRRKLEEERSFILGELKRAQGFRGRQPPTDEDNRNRIAVTNAIARAIDAITHRCQTLGNHLDRSVTTGHMLVYKPDTPIPWAF